MKPATYGAPEVRAVLGALGALEPIDAASWKLSGGEVPLLARSAYGWLHLDAEAAPAHLNGHAWAALERSAALPSGVKIVVPDGEDSLRVRAELPLDREIELSSRLGDAVSAIRQHASWQTPCDDTPTTPEPGEVPDLEDLTLLVGAAGWPDLGRLGEPFHVELEGPRGGALARVARRDDDVVEISVDLQIDAASASDDCNRATALLLLRVASDVRMIRATVVKNRPRFETVLGAHPTIAEIGHALSALSVGCSRAADEARALHGSEELARQYLATTGS